MLKKTLIVATAALMVVAAQAAFACDTAKSGCDKAKDASAAAVGSASCPHADGQAAGCAAKKASATETSVKQCTKAEKAACEKNKTAAVSSDSRYLCAGSRAKFADMAPFGFLKEASAAEVNVTVETTDSGFNLVFTGVNETNVDRAVQLANQSMEALGKPAACSTTRAGMIEKAGDSEAAKACISALADCSVSLVEIDGGAKTVITTEKPEKIQELHGVLVDMGLSSAPQTEVSTDSE